MTEPEAVAAFEIRTQRLVLTQPEARDADVITATCRDSVFERFMALPWPYERRHAEHFVDVIAPGGWLRGDEWTWAIREYESGPLLGVIGVRFDSAMLGYWMVSEHRGRGIITEATEAVIQAVFTHRKLDAVLWECVVGNVASARVAQKCGFTYAGEQPGIILPADGTARLSWTAVRRREDDPAAAGSWPALS